MAKILTQHDIPSISNSATHTYWCYNALDCMVTAEVAEVLLDRLAADPDAQRCYSFERAIQAPAMCMMLRGVRVDQAAAKQQIAIYNQQLEQLNIFLNELAEGHWEGKVKTAGKCPTDGKNHKWPRSTKANPIEVPPEAEWHCEKCGAPRFTPSNLNALSPLQMRKLLYTNMSLPEQYDHKTHEVSTNDECITKLRNKFPEHRGLLGCILACRRIAKQIGLLNSRCDPDGRWHSSFNVGATEVDRWSSSKSPFSTGTNLQNIADRSRNVIIPDPGLWLGYADLKSAESRVVAYDARDELYINAHERPGSDVHTNVCKLIWPELPWTELDNCGSDKHTRNCCNRGIAEQCPSFDPHRSIRLYSKKVQHGSNIGMTPFGIARETHIPLKTAKEVQKRYFDGLPMVKSRQQEIIHEVRTTGSLLTFLGRRRQFFGRLWDESTWREALAQTQQSTVGWLLNMALWRLWEEMDTQIDPLHAPHPDDPNRIWLLAQVHDAVLFEFRAGDFDTLRRVRELMTIPIPIHGRTLTIPVEILYGPHWRHDVLKEFKE